MEEFKRGDILEGTKRKFNEAYHPVVFINGPGFSPLAVILTHSNKFPCNIKLFGSYVQEDSSYFVAHLIEKMAIWGPYTKVGELIEEDIKLIESSVSKSLITWDQYLDYKKDGCPEHS